jgi:hypothetical protein
VGGRQVSSDRSHLPHMAGAEELSASLRPVPGNYAEARAERVLGVLAALACTLAPVSGTSPFLLPRKQERRERRDSLFQPPYIFPVPPVLRQIGALGPRS